MKRALFIAAVVAVGASAAWFINSSAEPPVVAKAPAPSPAFVAPQAPTTAVSAEPPCRFSAGQRLAFDLATTSTVSLSAELSQFTTGQRTPEATSTARLELEVLRVNTSSAVLLARLAKLGGALAGGVDGVGQSWLTEINERCEVAGFARHTTVTKKAGRQQQALLHELWFTLPMSDAPTAVSFETSMGRASGLVFPARSSAHTFVRTIQRFEQAWSSSMNGVVVARSRTEIRRGDGRWFDSLDGEEEFSVPGMMTKGTSSIKVTSATPDPATLAGASRAEADYVWESCLNDVPDQTIRPFSAADHEQRVLAMRNVTYPDALERMLTTFDATSNLHEQSRDMAAYLDAHPEAIPEYAGALLTEFEPEWKAAGFMALASTQNVAAREVLLDVWREREAPDLERIRASLALVTRRDVGLPLAREMLVEARRPGTPAQRNVSQQALLHVAVLTGLHPENDELRTEVHQGLVAEMSARPPSALDRAAVYSAIGNTGDVSFLPELNQASRHADPAWRAIVPIGMRRMPVDAVRDFTLEWLRRETSPEVMRELFELIQHQYQDVGRTVDPELAAEGVKYLRRQPRLLTRQSILQMLQPLVAVNDDVRAAFREQLQVEYEANTGMFAYVASCLPEEDVQAVLARIPSLADQHRGVAQQPLAAPAAPTPVVSGSPTDLLPKLTPETP